MATKLFLDTTTKTFYNALGEDLPSNMPRMAYKNTEKITIQCVTAASEIGTGIADPESWPKDTQFAIPGVTARLSADNNFKRIISGKLNTSISTGSMPEEVACNFSGTTLYQVPATGTIRIFDSYGEYENFAYSSRRLEENILYFTLASGQSAAKEYASGSVIDTPESLYMTCTMNQEESRPGDGLFVFDAYAYSEKLRAKADETDAQFVSDVKGLEFLPFVVQQDSTVLLLDSYICETFTISLTMADPNTNPALPDQETDSIAAMVNSLLSYGFEVQIYNSETGEWADYDESISYTQLNTKYRFRLKSSGESANWVEVPIFHGQKGLDGVTPSIGSNGNWFIGEIDTEVVATGRNAPMVVIQYSEDGSNWRDSYSSSTKFIRFSVDGGTTFSSSMKYVGDNAPQVRIQYSETGTVNTWHDILAGADFFIRFSVDNGTNWSEGTPFKAFAVKYQYGQTASSSFHDVFVPTTDKYIRFSNDGGITWSVAHKFVGDDGQSFVPDKTGVYEDLTLYDNEKQGFAFLVTSGANQGKIYFKTSDESGLWSDGLQFTPNGLSMQYSVDGISWHTTVSDGDKYTRFSTDGGNTWSSKLQVQGVGVYLYIAFAEDDIGNGFSLTRSSDLDYWNWIQTDTVIPTEELTAQKFAEMGTGWTLYQGDDGISYEWLSGTTVPNPALGKDGDWYLNTSAGDVYKKSGAWVFQMNIVGASGAGVTLKGNWLADMTYAENDMVTYNGSAYIALRLNTNAVPDVSPEDWIKYISKGDKGDPGAPLQDNYIDVTAVDGYIVVPNNNVPVKVEINNVGYDIDTCPVIDDGTNFKLLCAYFLAKANLASYTGTYRVWRAGGKAGVNGEDGEDGATPSIVNDYWYINGASTGVRAKGEDGKSFEIDVQGTTEQRLNYPAPTGDDIRVVFYDTTEELVYVGVYENSAWDWGTGISLKGDKGDPGTPNTLSIGTVTTGAEGTSAEASITGDSPNQTLNLTIPKGEKGDPFTIDATGLLANRGNYDAMEEGFAFLATDTGDVYFKQSDTSGDWSGAVPFKGEKGDKGEAGTNTYVLCLCQQSPPSLFDGMIWVKGGTDTPKYITAVGGVDVLTEEPADVSSLANGTFIITNTEE